MSTKVEIFRDGVILVDQILDVNETITSVSVPLLSTSVGEVLALDEASVPLD